MDMSHTLSYQFVHILWGTNRLLPLIQDNFKSDLYSLLTVIVVRYGGTIMAISAASNHIHLLLKIPTNISIMDLVRQLKACSSKWSAQHKLNKNFKDKFSWNASYSAFTVSPSSIQNVLKYFKTETERHGKISFEEELINFLNFHEISYVPKYLTETTFTKLMYHIIWSVKHWEPILKKSIQKPLHQKINEEILNCDCQLHAIGNVSDHIHLLVECPSKICIADLVQTLKTTSAHLIKSINGCYSLFSWQEGYGVFSVGKPAFTNVVNYVINQESHHINRTFIEEWDWLKTTLQ